ncbi:MAG TPA: ABC-type transport auxiliary lipoprotein family protein, partial [Candidatus Binataceae bacterium]|nr:ABC-type transport auxiliary lipoprotein family protein [Candidatus Binataceae bacterium]
MNRKIGHALSLLAAGALACTIAGCSSLLAPRPDPTKFYVLTPASETTAPAPQSSAGEFVLGLGPIKLPAYLDRAEVVTRAVPNRLDLSK